MEESEKSEFMNQLRIQFSGDVRTIKEYMDVRIEELEKKLQEIFWFIEFHLGEVPIKYRKAFPKDGEYPYIKTEKFKAKIHQIDPTTGRTPLLTDFEMPKDPSELAKSKERMLKLGEKGWPKRVNAEAFLASWEQRDSHQADKPNESSPSSQESPDHKNPPFQT